MKTNHLKYYLCISISFLMFCCKPEKKENKVPVTKEETPYFNAKYATGFTIKKEGPITLITVSKAWPNAEKPFTYALLPKEDVASINLNSNYYDAIVGTPVSSVVVTSTTHIPALESLGVLDKLIGFPATEYISSPAARKLIDAGKIKELGQNEDLNTELVLALQPDVVIGFSIKRDNRTYNTLERAKIPVVYNGDWTEETPLGKAEWLKFFAPFFGKEKQADSIFKEIEKSYLETIEIAKKATNKPTVLSGALYKDVWYLPGGKSWAAQFLRDANANYLWKNTTESGSLSLSIESVLEKGKAAEFWVAPSQFTSYASLAQANNHYAQFSAFKNKKIFTYANTKGATGGLLYYELAPNRPDIVLKDLVHMFHPQLLPNYQPYFFKPLE